MGIDTARRVVRHVAIAVTAALMVASVGASAQTLSARETTQSVQVLLTELFEHERIGVHRSVVIGSVATRDVEEEPAVLVHKPRPCFVTGALVRGLEKPRQHLRDSSSLHR